MYSFGKSCNVRFSCMGESSEQSGFSFRMRFLGSVTSCVFSLFVCFVVVTSREKKRGEGTTFYSLFNISGLFRRHSTALHVTGNLYKNNNNNNKSTFCCFNK